MQVQLLLNDDMRMLFEISQHAVEWKNVLQKAELIFLSVFVFYY